LKTHKTDKPIPFDRSFTLTIPKVTARKIDRVEAFEATFSNGSRGLLYSSFLCKNKKETGAVRDVILRTNSDSDTLQIYFPSLRPNKNFDINIVSFLSDDCRDQLMEVNSLLAQVTPPTDKELQTAFSAARSCTFDKVLLRNYFEMTDINSYKKFFSKKLDASYVNLRSATYKMAAVLSIEDIQAIDQSSKDISKFVDGRVWVETIIQKKFEDVQLGKINVTRIFLNDPIAGDFHLSKRNKNLTANLKYVDSLLQRVDRIISKGIMEVMIGTTKVNMDAVRTLVSTIKNNIIFNQSIIRKELKAINEATDAVDSIRQGRTLVGNTVSSDLKSAGGNVLFLDAGITNIFAQGLDNSTISIPKLYWGVSIYFRPIDKNTRRNRFPIRFDDRKKGCDGNGNYGPDYGIVTRSSIWQHLSLNVGITLGSMSNSDFGNLYNNNSLLVGPAYRFARAFKVSAGASFLNRVSKNPIISEKETIIGGYVSLSVDIDFIQGLKDVTAILFK
jgi:hypothetical protein